MEVFLVLLYFLTFDNSKMRPEEEINIPSIVNQLTDPEVVSRNIIANLVITAGTVSRLSLQSNFAYRQNLAGQNLTGS